MIPLQRATDVNTYARGEYALAEFPVMHGGTVYLTSARVVLVDTVNILGDIQKYILPGQRTSCRPHHLSRIHKIPKFHQESAGEWFHTVLFFESLGEAGRCLGKVFHDSVSPAPSSGPSSSTSAVVSGG